ncbi:MAG: helix-turn-helix domain-containing protein [Candidatus Thorarchaeota archaeon]
MTKKEIGNRIKYLREFLHLSQDQFAKKVGTHKQTISKYERGEQFPKVNMLNPWVDIFNVNLNWLLTGQGEMFLEKKQEEKKEEIVSRAEFEAFKKEVEELKKK